MLGSCLVAAVGAEPPLVFFAHGLLVLLEGSEGLGDFVTQRGAVALPLPVFSQPDRAALLLFAVGLDLSLGAGVAAVRIELRVRKALDALELLRGASCGRPCAERVQAVGVDVEPAVREVIRPGGVDFAEGIGQGREAGVCAALAVDTALVGGAEAAGGAVGGDLIQVLPFVLRHHRQYFCLP